MTETDAATRREWNAACDDIRMNAYYYSFNGTGERPIDLVLSAVATAGKAYHHTEGWTNDEDGPSHEERIQMAADAAAEEVRQLRARLAERELMMERVRKQAEAGDDWHDWHILRILDGE